MYKVGDVLEHRHATYGGLPLLGIIEKKTDDGFLIRISNEENDAQHMSLRYQKSQLDDGWKTCLIEER